MEKARKYWQAQIYIIGISICTATSMTFVFYLSFQVMAGGKPLISVIQGNKAFMVVCICMFAGTLSGSMMGIWLHDLLTKKSKGK